LGAGGPWVAVAAVALSGCASIVSGQNQVVSVDTPGCPGARCELVNDKGRFYVASTPGTVTLTRSYNNLQVTCTRGATTSAPVSVASATKAMAFGNLLVGGIIGAGVDVGTGAAYDYPQMISVPMDCSQSADGGAVPPSPRLGLQVEREPNAGVRIVAVEPALPGAAAGLQVGDVIVSVNGIGVSDPHALAAVIADPKTPAPWTFVVRRDQQETTLTVGATTAPGGEGRPTNPMER
jgi:membrane-associated protease RseP (regulator of RpoE activity)